MQVSGLARIAGIESDKNMGLRSDEKCGSQVGQKVWVSGLANNVGLRSDNKCGSRV